MSVRELACRLLGHRWWTVQQVYSDYAINLGRHCRRCGLFLAADPTPAARCPQQTPFVALSEPTCTRPEGHVGAHLFTSYDGKTPLEMMPK